MALFPMTFHTIAGFGLHPPEWAKGDVIVPLPSAHLDQAVSEHWVPAMHSNIYYHPQTIAEVQRILVEHAGGAIVDRSAARRNQR